MHINSLFKQRLNRPKQTLRVN